MEGMFDIVCHGICRRFGVFFFHDSLGASGCMMSRGTSEQHRSVRFMNQFATRDVLFPCGTNLVGAQRVEQRCLLLQRMGHVFGL